MPATLEILKVFNVFLCGVAISAMLHGLLCGLDKGIFIIPGLALSCLIASASVLDESIAPYGWLCSIAILLGVGVWAI